MDPRELRDALRRWQTAGLLTPDSTRAIEQFESTRAPSPAEPSRSLDAGAVLSYAGVLVALIATFALYGILFPDWDGPARIALSTTAAVVALIAAITARRMSGGQAASDALSVSWIALTAVAIGIAFGAATWFEQEDRGHPDYVRSLDQLRATFFTITAAIVLTGVIAARWLRSPLSALPAAIAAPALPAILVWWIDQRESDAPGLLAGETAVVVGLALALLALRSRERLSGEGHRFFVQLGLLGIANWAAIMLSAVEGGLYEGLLLLNAVAQAAVALSFGSRIWLTGFAVSLYAYVSFVVFRTFEAAALGVLVLMALGLLTAVGGLWVQRGGFIRLSQRLRN
jgi:hypothetical protein